MHSVEINSVKLTTKKGSKAENIQINSEWQNYKERKAYHLEDIIQPFSREHALSASWT